MKKIMALVIIILMVVLGGCSNVNTTEIKEQSVITEKEKVIIFQPDESELSSQIYEFLEDEDWKVVNENIVNSEETQKGVFEIKYKVKTNERRETYDGYINVVDCRNGKFVSSIRFKNAEDNEILDELEDSLNENIKIEK